jgi:hypothetical protein
MEDIFLRCGIQWKRFFFVVGYTGRSFPPLWDITEEVFSIVGYNGRGFFPLWDTMEKKHTTLDDIFFILSASHCLQIKFFEKLAS